MTEYIDPVFGTRRTQEGIDTNRQIREYGESLLSAGEQAAEQRERERQQAAFEEYLAERIREWVNHGGTEQTFRAEHTEAGLLREYLGSKDQRDEAAHARRVSGHTSVF